MNLRLEAFWDGQSRLEAFQIVYDLEQRRCSPLSRVNFVSSCIVIGYVKTVLTFS